MLVFRLGRYEQTYILALKQTKRESLSSHFLLQTRATNKLYNIAASRWT